jgi:hypothetical protein
MFLPFRRMSLMREGFNDEPHHEAHHEVQFVMLPEVQHQVVPVAGTNLPAAAKPVEAARTGALLWLGTLGPNTTAHLQLGTLLRLGPLLL